MSTSDKLNLLCFTVYTVKPRYVLQNYFPDKMIMLGLTGCVCFMCSANHAKPVNKYFTINRGFIADGYHNKRLNYMSSESHNKQVLSQ